MRRNMAVTLIAILAAISFAGVTFAAHMITGEVISANPSEKVLTIRAQGKEMAFSVLENAAKPLINLKRGDNVSVSYFDVGGSLTAEFVEKS